MAWKRVDAAISPALPSGLGPADLQAAYNLPSSTNGTFQTVAVVDAFDDPKADADLAVYRSTFSLPPCTTANGCFLRVNQSGMTASYPITDPGPPGSSSPYKGGWEEEESLDLDMVSAVCPNCHVLLVEANSDNSLDLYAAEDTAATKCGATEISNSWSGAEYAGEQGDDVHFNHPGIPTTFASGDSGYPGGYPPASQYVTAVGGTTLVKKGGVWSETGWVDTGALCSVDYPQPSWQTALGGAYTSVCSMRFNNDVSAVADPGTPVAVYDTFTPDSGWGKFGGTSVATPIIAGVYALAGNGASINDGSYSYAHKTQLNNITKLTTGTDISGCPSGSPSYVGTFICDGETGYNGPTGNGTPNGTGGF